MSWFVSHKSAKIITTFLYLQCSGQPYSRMAYQEIHTQQSKTHERTIVVRLETLNAQVDPVAGNIVRYMFNQ